MDVLGRHIINQHIAIHELKLTHASKLIMWCFRWFSFLVTCTWSFSLNPKWKMLRRMLTLSCDFQRLLWQSFFSNSWNYEKWISEASLWSVKHFQWTHCPSRCGQYSAKPFSRFEQSIVDLSINTITIICSMWSF